MPDTRTEIDALPPYGDFVASTAIAGRVKEIHSFSFHVRYQQNAILTDPSVSDKILATCIDSVIGALKRTGIEYAHFVKGEVQRASKDAKRLDESQAIVGVRMSEGVYAFKLSVFDDRIVVSRDSSTFSDFYDWYRLFMPEVRTIEATLRRTIESISSRKLEIVETVFRFKFNFSDFASRGNQRRPASNVDVLEGLIPTLPSHEGRQELSQQSHYRVDLTLSRLEEFLVGGRKRKRNCWYVLEAPFNELGRFLVFDAQVRNSSLKLLGDPDEEGDGPNMVPMDEDFGDEYAFVMSDYLRNRALEGFMGRILEHWDFATQRQL